MLAFLKAARGGEGWTSMLLSPNRIDLAHVILRREAKPVVAALDSFKVEKGEIEALRALRKGRKVQGRVSVLLRHGQYQMLQVEAPPGPVAERKDALRWQVKDMLEFPVDAATLDVFEIPDSGGAGRQPQVYLVAASDARLQPTIRAFQAARQSLDAIDIAEMAQRNVASLFAEANRGVALLVFDDDCGLLTFSRDGELFVSRHIDISLTQLAQATAERRDQLYERIALEVQRSLDNFDRIYSQIPISRVLVAPVPGAEGFLDFLRGNLSLPVLDINLSDVIDHAAVPELRDPGYQARHLRLIGAAMREATT